MAATLGGDAPVAIGAANIAPFDFSVDRLEAATEPREGRDLVSLACNVIEVEDDGIPLAAVHASTPGENRVEMSDVARDGRAGVRALRRL